MEELVRYVEECAIRVIVARFIPLVLAPRGAMALPGNAYQQIVVGYVIAIPAVLIVVMIIVSATPLVLIQ
jgi:hypothetical protein